MDIFSTKTSYQEHVGPRSLSGGASRRSFRKIPWKTLKTNTFCEKNPFILVVNFFGMLQGYMDIYVYIYIYVYMFLQGYVGKMF